MDTLAEYVIVGAGSAGCVLADRLSADGEARVVLVEAGGVDRELGISIPAAFPRLFGTAVDWGYSTVEQNRLAGRRIFWPCGKVLGGSSSLNAQIWTRGHPADYDGWAAGGCTGWSSKDVLRYFQRAEDRRGGAGSSEYGVGGPTRIEDLREPSPVTLAFLAACGEAGHPSVGDGESSAGAGHGSARVTQSSGRRWSSADAYLRPALGRPNLAVMTSGHVHRIVLDGDRSVGVEVETDLEVRFIGANREVILAAGAVGSPKILMLSGIGDADHLRALGLPVKVVAPEVGRNLADHLYVPLAVSAREPVSPGVGDQREDAKRYLRSRGGRLSSNLAEALVFLRTDDRLPAPDIEVVWMVVPFLDHGRTEPGHGVTAGVVLLQPEGRGRIELLSADPKAAPRIDPRYLSDPSGQDLRTMIRGVRSAQTILAQDALVPWLGDPLVPGMMDPSPESIEAVVEAGAQTLYHPIGTCRMGADQSSVVDPECRVRGVAGLRVVDASVMPQIPRAHTHAPVVMLAEKASDLILGDWRGGSFQSHVIEPGR